MKRTHVLLNAETATTPTTRVIDLDVADPISRLAIEYKPTNNGATPTGHPDKCITKIEVVDGSDVIASVSGIEARAAQILDGRDHGYHSLSYINDNINSVTLFINFGRWLWDKMLAFDPRKFTNPQIKITHDRTLGGSSPDAATLSVFADIFDGEQLSPVGFLSLREIVSYSLTSSAQERVDLPIDRVIRRLIVQSLAADKQPWEQYNKIKLTVDSDKKVLLNEVSTSQLLKVLAHNPRFYEYVYGNIANATVTHYITPAHDVAASMVGVGTAITGEQYSGQYGGNIDLTVTSTGDIVARVEGMAPHGALNIPLGDQKEIADWLDLSGARKFEAVMTAGSSVGSNSTAQVLAETLRKY